MVRLGHQIIEDMTDGLPCDSCSFEGTEAIAEFRCINCKDYLCAECNRAHKKTRITRNHDIVEVRFNESGIWSISYNECNEGLSNVKPELSLNTGLERVGINARMTFRTC